MTTVASIQVTPTTQVAPCHRRAVERVIKEVSERLGESHSLHDLASLAFLSPYHFHRVFRQATGLPPRRFLVALRIEAARRLLLTSELSVTEISLEVGYHSLGTFTSQFSKLVGLSPRAFRKLAKGCGGLNLPFPEDDVTDNAGAVGGQISADDGFAGLALVGLFPTPVPEGHPSGCAIAAVPGPYRVVGCIDGVFHVLAVAFSGLADPLDRLMAGDEMLIGRSAGTVLVRTDREVLGVDIPLALRRLTDPPILFVPTAVPRRGDRGPTVGDA